MKPSLWMSGLVLLAALPVPAGDQPRSRADVASTRRLAELWRSEHRLIDLHQHIDCTEEHLARAVRIMDAAGIGLAVDLSGGSVTHEPGKLSEFERNQQLADRLCPGRFVHYLNLDYTGWDNPDFSEQAVKQIEAGHRLGAAGLKEFKRLGLSLRDAAGKLIKVDDPRLDPVWKRCGELGMPVSIHVADPRAFWLPYNPTNERWQELKDHRDWWFGDAQVYPPFEELLAALNRVIERHPETTFVCVHFANNAEDLDWVERSLDRYPNMYVDLAARIPEIGRHDPEKVRRVFLRHQDRILFGTDFQVYDRLILGSSGNEPPPTDDDAQAFFAKHWRWLETNDRHFEHMTPIQGDWKIDAIGLPASVLRKIYFDNARKLLARSLPRPVIKARWTSRDFPPNGNLSKPAWKQAQPVRLEYASSDASARPEISSTVRALWSEEYLYLGYECPFSRLTVFEPAEFAHKRYDMHKEGASLWDRDVIEAFINADPPDLRHYSEYQVAPTNERLDLMLHLPDRDFAWRSGFRTAVRVDQQRKVWTAELRIPLAALSGTKPGAGTRWRINLFRCDRAHTAFLAWNPTLTRTFHTPERFGVLEFSDR